MDPIIHLWLPILVSAVVVFLVSSILHMAFTYHNSDYNKFPSEDQIMNDLGKYNIPAGDYMMPYTTDSKERNSQEFKDKCKRGPAGVITIFKPGDMGMGTSLTLWFAYCLIVGVFSAYIAGHALQPGAHYLAAFRFAGATAFTGYSLALMQQSIWYKKSWSATLKSMFDGLIYALLTGGVFGWLWPAM
jgi:hypothetical protein